MKQTSESPTPQDIPQSVSPDEFLVPSQVTVGGQAYDLGLKVDLARLMPILAKEASQSESLSIPSVDEALAAFLKSRKPPREGHRGTREGYYTVYLPPALAILGLRPTPAQVMDYINSLSNPDRKPKPMAPGGQAACFRALKAFFNWLHSSLSTWGGRHGAFKPDDSNPFHKDNNLKPPDVPKRLLPAQTEKSVLAFMSEAGKGKHPIRDQAILALLIESGARLEEIVIEESDIDWDKRQFRTVEKGGHEVRYAFGPFSESLMKTWLSTYRPNGAGIWGLKVAGVREVCRRLEERTGKKCNPHTYRRGFARIQRERGVDSLDIMRLGNWSSLEMVLRYTRSVDFDNAQKRYQPPLQAENPRVPSSILGLGT